MMDRLLQLYLEYRKVCTDTRKVTKGALFFALKGGNFNGNAFAEAALEKGCSYAIIDEPKYKTNDRYLVVDDVLTTLQDLARQYRSTLKIPVIGITGSNGKTTTKELIAATLSQKYETFATEGNLNNHIGVPLSVLSIAPTTEIAIIEMGANHVGEIRELCSISQPSLGLITNIGRAHLEGFGGIEGVIKAKRQLYDHLRDNEGLVFVNGNNELLIELSEGIERITYGRSEQTVYHGLPDAHSYMLRLTWEVNPRKKLDIQTNLVGQYNFENAMAAIAIARYFGVTPAKVKKALETYAPSNNRSQQLMVGPHTVIMDAYNANPTSMGAALGNFAQTKSPIKAVVLGDMLELGDYSQKEHQAVADRMGAFDHAMLVGKEFMQTQRSEGVQCFASVEELIETAPQFSSEPIHFLIKGSRGIRLERFLQHLQQQYAEY